MAEYEKITEKIKKKDVDEEITERLSVPGGWIVRISGRLLDESNSQNNSTWTSERFINDKDHRWSLTA